MTEVQDKPDKRRTSALAVLAFVLRYWRTVPWRSAVMVAGTTLGVLVEVRIPSASADLAVAVEGLLTGATGADAARGAAWVLLGTFAAVFVIKQLYLRNWMYIASQIMKQLLTDGFRHVQRFSHEWHTNNFAGSTQRKITRGMWAYDTLADTLVTDLVPGIGLLFGFTIAMSLRDATLGAYFGTCVVIFLARSKRPTKSLPDCVMGPEQLGAVSGCALPTGELRMPRRAVSQLRTRWRVCPRRTPRAADRGWDASTPSSRCVFGLGRDLCLDEGRVIAGR